VTAARFVDAAALPGLPAGGRQTTVLAAVAGAAAIGAAAALDPAAVDDGPVLCPFRLVTGLPCPGCGLTRSWVHLAHGEIGAGVAEHPFGLVSLVAVVLFVLAVAAAPLRRASLPDVGRLLGSRWFLAVGAVWIGYGVARLGWLVAG
jgi:hypothetical protein